ncbi:PEP-CTERM protein-sorting domain-containing protein [Verrucomicrobium sp. GAS474]|uniref:beta strand repeat-containing protein n=1 Tax=Verrucomicrobium sp. GAS474 TaxID=1882831 RepID=UPI00087AF4AF|nr:PEP-CTERM sorting domain-containing protein [Verrucomicrobium sp. GAS474]SDU11801.1 PEP-CTERM protein-sorting domain-containing protein [Verrucomicrobium sp. GAS474]
MKSRLPLVVLLGGVMGWLGAHASAQVSSTYTGASGGLWSAAGNWSNGIPGSSGTAIYAGSSADTTVLYDSSASSSLGTMQWGESNGGFTNLLDIVKGGSSGTPSLTIASDLTLGSSSGTALVRLDSSASTAVYLKIGSAGTGTVTLNAGGELDLLSNATTATLRSASVGGNVALAGGILYFASTSSTSSTAPTITGNLSISSGTLNVGDVNSRVHVNGNFTATGGTISAAGTSGLVYLYGATNSLSSSVAVTSAVYFHLSDSGVAVNQSFSTDANIPSLNLRSSSGIKTLSGSGTIGVINLGGYTTATTLTLKLGSNLAVSGGFGTGNWGSGGTAATSFVLDTNGYNWATSGANTLTFQNPQTVAATWTIKNSASILSTITAKNFVFSSGTTNAIAGPVTLSAAGTTQAFYFGGSAAATVNLDGSAGTVTLDAGTNAMAFSASGGGAGVVNTTGSVVFKSASTGTAFDLSAPGSSRTSFGTGTVLWSTGNRATTNLGAASALNPGVLFRYTGTSGKVTTGTTGQTVGGIEVGDGVAASTLAALSWITLGGDLNVKASSTFTAGYNPVVLVGAANLVGTGTLDGNYSFDPAGTGGIAPNGTGTVGTLHMSSASTLTLYASNVSTFDIAGLASFDLLDMNGSALNYGDSVLRLNFLGGYRPGLNATFTLVTNNQDGSGTFSSITSNIGETFSFNAATGTVTVIAVPEPATLLELLAGLLCVAGGLRRKIPGLAAN